MPTAGATRLVERISRASYEFHQEWQRTLFFVSAFDSGAMAVGGSARQRGQKYTCAASGRASSWVGTTQVGECQSPSWTFLGVNPGLALVDTAAQHSLVGRTHLERHDQYLQENFQIQVVWTDRPAGPVHGVSGKSQESKVAYIPIGVGGVNGVLQVQVVPGGIPLLLSIPFLKGLGSVVDLTWSEVWYQKLGVGQELHLETKHIAVSVLEFSEQGWSAPPDVDRLGISWSRIWIAHDGQPTSVAESEGVQLFEDNRREGGEYPTRSVLASNVWEMGRVRAGRSASRGIVAGLAAYGVAVDLPGRGGGLEDVAEGGAGSSSPRVATAESACARRPS